MDNYKCFFLLLLFFLCKKEYSQLDSTYKVVYKNGKPSSEGAIVKWKKEGVWKFYNDSLGYLNKIQKFKNNYPDGEIIEYNSSGRITLKGTFSEKAIKHKKKYDKITNAYYETDMSLPVGEWLYYNDDSKLVKKEIYNTKGKLLKRQIIK